MRIPGVGLSHPLPYIHTYIHTYIHIHIYISPGGARAPELVQGALRGQGLDRQVQIRAGHHTHQLPDIHQAEPLDGRAIHIRSKPK